MYSNYRYKRNVLEMGLSRLIKKGFFFPLFIDFRCFLSFLHRVHVALTNSKITLIIIICFPSERKKASVSHTWVWLKSTCERSLWGSLCSHHLPQVSFKIQHQQSNTPKYLHFAILLLSPNKLCFYNFSVLQKLKCVSLF